jgi:hypothetical protein
VFLLATDFSFYKRKKEKKKKKKKRKEGIKELK